MGVSPRRGRLLFGHVYEDAEIEAQVLPPAGPVLCIASGGETALTLAARGWAVTAVDSNPAQLAYVRERLNGGGPRHGSVERLLALIHVALKLGGWRRRDLERFCELDNPDEQLRQWRERLDTRGFHAVLAAFLSPASVRAAGFAAFTARSSSRFDVLIRQRLERGISRHPNRTNPFIRRLLLGDPGPALKPADAGRVTLRQGDIAEYLESVPPGSFAGLSLSNVLDANRPGYAARLEAAVRRAAAPGAVAVWRSFAEGDSTSATWAAKDRSMFWGALQVERFGDGR